MMFLCSLLMISFSMALDSFASARLGYAPGARTHGQVESYSLGWGFGLSDDLRTPDVKEFNGELIFSFNYSKNVHLGFSESTIPSALGPSIRIRVYLVEYPDIKLFFSEQFSVLFNVSSGDEPLALEQNASVGMKIKVLSSNDKNIFLCPEMGFIPIMWAPYFSVDAHWEF